MIQKLYLHLKRLVEPVCQAGCLNVLVVIPAWRLEYRPQGMCLHLLPPPRLLHKRLMSRFKGKSVYALFHTILFHKWEYFVTQDRVTELGDSRMRNVTAKYGLLRMVQPRSNKCRQWIEYMSEGCQKWQNFREERSVSHNLPRGHVKQQKKLWRKGQCDKFTWLLLF